MLEGRAHLRPAGRSTARAGHLRRVGPNEKRKLTTGEDGAVILALGGIPGKAFAIFQPTEEGEPDPFAAASE